jgi:hypothetical protein
MANFENEPRRFADLAALVLLMATLLHFSRNEVSAEHPDLAYFGQRSVNPSDFGTICRNLALFIRCGRPIQLDVTQRIELEFKHSETAIGVKSCNRGRELNRC